MSREVIPGETVPLGVFSVEMKRRAEIICQRATGLGMVAPDAVVELLRADPDDLRVAQRGSALTYHELDEWVEKQVGLLQAASDWFESLDS